MGIAFLASDVKFYQTCGLPRGVGLALKSLADQVRRVSLFMDVTQTPANSVGGKLSNQTASRKLLQALTTLPIRILIPLILFRKPLILLPKPLILFLEPSINFPTPH